MILKKVKTKIKFVDQGDKNKKGTNSYTGGYSSGMNVENPPDDDLSKSNTKSI